MSTILQKIGSAVGGWFTRRKRGTVSTRSTGPVKMFRAIRNPTGAPMHSVKEAEDITATDLSVPVVYGNIKIEGRTVWIGNIELTTDTAEIRRYGNDADQAYIMSMWHAVGMGKLELLGIRADDKILVDGIDFGQEFFNDGTEVYIPNITSDYVFTIGTGDSEVAWATDLLSSINTNDESNNYEFERFATNGVKIVCLVDTLAWDYSIAYTYDMQNWTYPTSYGYGMYMNDIKYQDGVWLIVGGQYLEGHAWVYRSTNGTDWDGYHLTDLPKNELTGVVWDGSYWYATGWECIFRSKDGVNWENVLTLDSQEATQDIVSVGGYLIAVGATNSFHPCVWRSTNGVDWTKQELSTDHKSLLRLVWDGDSERLYAFHSMSSYDDFFYSDDYGETWTQKAFTPTNGSQYATYAYGKLYVAVGANIYYSTDKGDTWTLITTGLTNSIKSLKYNELFDFKYSTKLKGIAHHFFPEVGSGDEDFRVVANSEGKIPVIEYILKNNTESSPVTNNKVYLSSGKFAGTNPAAVIYDLLTNEQYGLAVPASNIDLASFNEVSEEFNSSRPYGLNFAIDERTGLDTVLDAVMDVADVFLYVDNDIFHLSSLYRANATPVETLYDDDFRSFTFTRESWLDVPSEVEAEYVDSDLHYFIKKLNVKNEAALLTANGAVNKKQLDLKWFNNIESASIRLHEIMQRESFPRVNISAIIDRSAYYLRTGDLVNVVNTEYGIAGTFRVTNITFGSLSDMDIGVELEQAFEDLWDGNATIVQAARGVVPQRPT